VTQSSPSSVIFHSRAALGGGDADVTQMTVGKGGLRGSADLDIGYRDDSDGREDFNAPNPRMPGPIY
jgi:hypothetical protein